MSLSFGDCEPNEGPNKAQGFGRRCGSKQRPRGLPLRFPRVTMGRRAVITTMLPLRRPATGGLQVSGLASTPFNVAVGGTDFNDGGTLANPTGTQGLYFSNTNNPTTLASALSYIPETTWNQSCTNAFFGSNAETNCNTGPRTYRDGRSQWRGQSLCHCQRYDLRRWLCETRVPAICWSNGYACGWGTRSSRCVSLCQRGRTIEQ